MKMAMNGRILIKTASNIAFLLAALVALSTLSGCAQPWVKPYERGNLADPIMKEQHALSAYYMKHVYENRESARGADGGSGGGCGCN